jgi:hypothetical protein
VEHGSCFVQSAGGVQAAALTWATCTALHTGGRSQRGAARRDASSRAAHQRRRHLHTVSSHTRSDGAMRALYCLWAAASTFCARVTRRCSVRLARTRRVSARRCEPVNVIRSGTTVTWCVVHKTKFPLVTSAPPIT